MSNEWQIAGHNGILVDPTSGDVGVDNGYARDHRVVWRESDDDYNEFTVSERSAAPLAAYLNRLEALAALAGEMREWLMLNEHVVTSVGLDIVARYDALTQPQPEVKG